MKDLDRLLFEAESELRDSWVRGVVREMEYCSDGTFSTLLGIGGGYSSQLSEMTERVDNMWKTGK